jgi:hypothetical protein
LAEAVNGLGKKLFGNGPGAGSSRPVPTDSKPVDDAIEVDLEQLVKYFGFRFEELFEVVLVNPETGQEKVLSPIATRG